MSRHNEFQQGMLTTGQHGLQVTFQSRLEGCSCFHSGCRGTHIPDEPDNGLLARTVSPGWERISIPGSSQTGSGQDDAKDARLHTFPVHCMLNPGERQEVLPPAVEAGSFNDA